jgi:hypothetical protein
MDAAKRRVVARKIGEAARAAAIAGYPNSIYYPDDWTPLEAEFG